MVGKWFENGLHMGRKEFAVHLPQEGGKKEEEFWVFAESKSEKMKVRK